jgi:Helix-turn-helix domain
MSIKIMSRVWDESPFDQTTLLIQLCLADHADDDGRCWPSIPRLAKKARCSERWARDVIKELAEKGYLERDVRPGKSTMYRLLFPATVPELGITPAESSPLN